MFDSLRTKPENIERDVTLIKKFAKSYKQNLSFLARFSSVVVHEKKNLTNTTLSIKIRNLH